MGVIAGASVWSELRDPTEEPPMIDMMMSLRTFAEQSADADVLRETIRFATTDLKARQAAGSSRRRWSSWSASKSTAGP